jgi:hypothetical protein
MQKYTINLFTERVPDGWFLVWRINSAWSQVIYRDKDGLVETFEVAHHPVRLFPTDQEAFDWVNSKMKPLLLKKDFMEYII